MNIRHVGVFSFAGLHLAAHGHHILGKGFNVVTDNLWEMSGVYPLDVLADDVPESCYETADCSHTAVSVNDFFETTREWTDKVKLDFGISASANFGEVGLSVSASLGYSSDLSRGCDRKSLYVETYNRQVCYRMKSECYTNATYLHPSVLQVASGLPSGATDKDTMATWVELFIQRFGTHIVIESENGAKVHSLTSADSSTEVSSECLTLSACLSASYTKVSGNLCANTSQCQMKKGTDTTLKTTCVLVGGDVDASSSSLCAATGSDDALNKFLASGDMNSSSSVIRYTFGRISDIFLYNGQTAIGNTLAKALEYQSCIAPRYSWTAGSDGSFYCKCALSCNNGGTLDEDTCTCKCRGDGDHGWQGATCDDTYGTCQEGQGSGNPGSAFKCAFDNQCSSWTSHNTCKPTDVCCLTDFNGKCCPFGNSCHCGTSNCDCVAPPSSNVSLAELFV